MSRLPLYLTQFLSGVVWVTLGPLLDSILRDLGIPLSRGGIVALAFFLGSVIGLVSLNVLLARVPIKWCLVGAGLLEAAALAAAGLLSYDSWSLLVSFFFMGFAAVILGAVPGMWLSAHVKEGTARAMTVMMMSSVSGMTLTPIVLGVLLNSGANWRSILAGEAVFALVLTLILAVLPLADIPRRENLRPRHVRAVIAFNPRLLAAIVAASFMYLGAEMTLIVWLPKFELDVFGASATWASLSVTFYFIGQIVGRLIAIPFTRRFLASSLLFVCAIAMGVFAGAIGLSPSQGISLALIFCAGLGSSARVLLHRQLRGQVPRLACRGRLLSLPACRRCWRDGVPLSHRSVGRFGRLQGSDRVRSGSCPDRRVPRAPPPGGFGRSSAVRENGGLGVEIAGRTDSPEWHYPCDALRPSNWRRIGRRLTLVTLK